MKVLIVDDEPLARDELHYLVEQSPQVTTIFEADGVASAQQVIDREHPDLMFLDIQLTEGSGMALAERLKAQPHHPYIVFATAYDQYALDAFRADAVDYLLKPFSQQRVDDAIERVSRLIGPRNSAPVQQSQWTNPRLSLTSDERTIVLQKETILYIQAQSGGTTVWVKDGHQVVSKQALTRLLKQLDPDQFIRVHRSFAVNLNMVSELQPSFNHTYELTLKDGSKVPVSRSYVAPVKRALGIQ